MQAFCIALTTAMQGSACRVTPIAALSMTAETKITQGQTIVSCDRRMPIVLVLLKSNIVHCSPTIITKFSPCTAALKNSERLAQARALTKSLALFLELDVKAPADIKN